MEIKDRENSLIKNTGILAVGVLCSKIFSFLLLPLYTSVLTTEDYGTVDVLQTVTSFAMPFITMMLCSAIFRFIIEKNEQKNWEEVITTGVLIETINIAAFAVIVAIINHFRHIEYCGLFILYFSALAFLEIVQNTVRGFGNNALYSMMSFSMTFVSLTANVVMILGLGMQGDSILLSASIAYITASSIGIIRMSLWKYFRMSMFSLKTLKGMLWYSLPLIPNAVSWWIANTSNRLVIRFFLGATANGIYAAANKISTIYTTIFNVYNIAWVEAISRSMGDEKQEEFINSMFEKSIRFFSCICLGIICCMSLFFNLLIGVEYMASYHHIYILLIAIFFNSLCSLLGGIFTAFMKSDIIGKTTVWGAAANLAFNLILINWLGLYAASLATLLSYIIIVAIRTIKVRKLVDLHYPIKFLSLTAIVTVIATIGYFSRNYILNTCILVFLVGWSIYSNQDVFKTTLTALIKKVRR